MYLKPFVELSLKKWQPTFGKTRKGETSFFGWSEKFYS